MDKENAKIRIKKALQLAGKKQSHLAKMLGYERGTVSEMLNGSGEPPLKYIEATSKLTGFTIEWLGTGKGPPKIEGYTIADDDSAIKFNEPNEIYDLQSEVERLRKENEQLKIQNEALLKAFRAIGHGQSESKRNVANGDCNS